MTSYDELLLYEPETGFLRWRVPRGRSKAGSIAGSLHKGGHIQIQIGGKIYKAHRIAHLLMTGHWPEGNPEHENRIKSDNRWSNIKDLATKRENGGNRGPQLNNTSGLKGVSWNRRAKKWQAQIVFGRHIHLGLFEDLRLAGLTYDAASKLVFGLRFSCLNFSAEDSDHIVLSDRIMRLIGGL